MRMITRVVASLSLASALGASVLGQPPTGGVFGGGGIMGRGGMDPAMLLMNKSVQEELKISEDDARAIIQKYNDETSSLLVKVLEDKGKKDQAVRLNQIRIQQMGFRAFADEKVASALKLTNDQKNEIREIAEDLRKEVDAMRKDAGMDFSKVRDIMRKSSTLQKDAVAKVNEMFSSDQKKAWKELVGTPFEMKMEFGGGRPGGRRPPSDN
ncbi:MAG: hypothetical protein ACKO26_10475 [Planctomycetota bacterium]